MRVTIDTNLKQITLHGSFKYSEFVAFHQSLPEDWVGYQYNTEPVPFGYNFPTVFDFSVPCTNPIPTDGGSGDYVTNPNATISDTQLPLFGDTIKSST